MSFLQPRPYMVNGGEGAKLRFRELLIHVRATTEQTGGVFNLFEIVCPAGFSSSLHIHYSEDVAVFVLSGGLTIFWGDERNEAGPGSYVFQPRGTPHGFRVNAAGGARILYATFPAGFDRFIVKYGQLPVSVDPKIELARYKVEVLGPLPD